jgi:dihydropteroate synthase
MKPDAPWIMGILNATPDSFSDGGRFNQLDAALCRVEEMLAQGADVIDVGGESTRPGATPVSLQEEQSRVLPLVNAILRAFPAVRLSIDTSQPILMHQCLDLGVWMINDVRGLSRPGALDVCAGYDAQLCLMHMQGEPQTMQASPRYQAVLPEVQQGLMARVMACREKGISPSRLWLDPGFGFGKSPTHNYQLLAQLKSLTVLGLPVLVGVSRKSMIGHLLPDLSIEERDAASMAAALWAVEQGAKMVRVHNVKMMKEGLSVWQALKNTKE